jgi:cyclohexa-1,5-dienecarbonyl-CoA hydratase
MDARPDVTAAPTRVEARVLCDGRVREIRFRRPPVNVLDLALLAELDRALAANGQSVVVLRGEGKHFSAGVDVADHGPEKVAGMIDGFHGVLHRLESLDAISIAAVQGAALGGGCEVALTCDLVVATADARLGLPEIRLGVFPPWAAARFARRYPSQAIADLVLTGEEVSGERAHALGLVARVAPPGGLDTALDQLLGQLVRSSDAALRCARRALALGRTGRADADRLAAVERLYLGELMATEDAHEGLRSFVERRPPVWRHR